MPILVVTPRGIFWRGRAADLLPALAELQRRYPTLVDLIQQPPV